MTNLRSLIRAVGICALLGIVVVGDDKTSRLGAETETGLERVQPLAPEAALKTFAMRDGFSMQLVAAEPLVTDPVAGAFDEDGRLYVVEMNDYPYTDKDNDKPFTEKTTDLPIGKVRLLVDSDGDGVFDRSTIFARDLSWPTGIAVFRGGVFVAATPDVWYFKDEDGDGVADVRQKVFTGFRKLNVQAVVNNLIWGLDHRIYGAGGTNGGKIVSMLGDPNRTVTISRNDFCFDPAKPDEFELLSGGARFGNTFDDWGNRFNCNIRNPIQHIVLPLRYLSRNRSLSSGSPVNDVAEAGDQLPVYRASPPEPWRVINAARLSYQDDPRIPRSEKNAQGYVTSVSGVTVYRGDAYPEEYRQQVLMGEVAGNLIHRQRLSPEGVTFTSARIDENTEFLTSTDNWFRPVNFVHAPDGTLYLLDMYRETIEHPWSMPDDLKAMLDLENGRDRGRIYRITPPGFKHRTTPKLSRASTVELVSLLKSPNAWTAETAHRLLFERQDPEAVKPLGKLLSDETSPLGRLRALWSLKGMGKLEDHDLLARLRDSSPGVRRKAVLIAEDRLRGPSAEGFLKELLKLAGDDSPEVVLQVAFTLGEVDDPRSREALQQIALRHAHDHWIVTAVLSAPFDVAPELLKSLVVDQSFLENAANVPLLRQLALMTGVKRSTETIQEVVSRLAGLPEELRTGRAVAECLLAVDEGLKRARSSLKEAVVDADARSLLTEQVAIGIDMIRDQSMTPAERLEAMRRLVFAEPELVRELAVSLVSAQEPAEIQTAAVRALSGISGDDVTRELLELFPAATPAVQYEIVEAIAGNTNRIPALFDAVESSTIPAAQITPIRRNLLLNHANEELRQRAQKLLAIDRETPRSQVVAEYRPALDLRPVRGHGRELFVRECATCHKIGETGQDVGPSLITVRHRSPAELLTHILDPNREVGPGFMQFAVALKDGQILTGMIAEESPSSITLKQAGNRQDILLREQIEEIKATGLSLMPEGLEKKLSPQDLADLIAFLKE